MESLILSLGGMGLGAFGMFGIYRLISRWLERRYEVRLAASGGSREELDAVRARIEALEEVTYRLQELEERVDFAERVLAQHSDRDHLPPVN